MKLATDDNWSGTYPQDDIDSIARAHKAVFEALKSHAEHLVDSYWQNTISENREKQNSDKGWVGPRMRDGKDGVFYIVWEFYNRKKRESTTYSQHIRKSASSASGYKPSHFRKYAQEWELPVIMEYEEQFDEIRCALRHLTRSRSSVVKFISAVMPDSANEG